MYASLAMFLIACNASQFELNASKNAGAQDSTAMTEQSPVDQVSESATSEVPMAESMNSSPVEVIDSQTASGESTGAPVEQQAGMSQDSNNADVTAQEQEKQKVDSKS